MNGILRLTFRQMLGGRRIWLLSAFLSLPILLLGAVLLSKGFFENEGAEDVAMALFLYVLFPHFLCVLASLLYGASLLAGEIEDKTLVYLFSRALPRWRILVGKYIATTCILGGMVAVSMSVCFLMAGRPVGVRLWLALLATVFAACLAYTAIFALLGIVLPRRAMTIGLIYAVIVEFLLSLVPAVVNEMTVSHYLRSLAYHIAGLDLPPEAMAIIGDASPTRAVVALVVIPLGALLLSAIVIHKREWPLTEGV